MNDVGVFVNVYHASHMTTTIRSDCLKEIGVNVM